MLRAANRYDEYDDPILNDDAVRVALARWPNGCQCVFCRSYGARPVAKGAFQCQACGRPFHVITNSGVTARHLSMKQLADAFEHVRAHKPASSRKLAAATGLSHVTAHRILRALRKLPEFAGH